MKISDRQIGEWCSSYNTLQTSYITPRWTDKITLDADGNVRDFDGNIIGHCGRISYDTQDSEKNP